MPIAYSISPSQISKFYKREFNPLSDVIVPPLESLELKKKEESLKNLDLKRKTNELSKNSRKKLKNKINWLCYLSKKRDIKINKRKVIPNFQVAFITLKLPAAQFHDHATITKVALNNFLNIIRNKFNVNNYVWRAELQKNGNIHYHLLIDKFVHHSYIRNYWNSSIGLLGYLTAYADKFKNMSLHEYHAYRSNQGSSSWSENKKAYNFGQNSQWLSPNSTDVHSLRNVDNAAAYVAAYVSKKQPENPTKEYLESIKNLTGRLWACSYSLSKLSSVPIEFSNSIRSVFLSLSNMPHTYHLCKEYVEVVYFNINKLSSDLSFYLSDKLLIYALHNNYFLPCSP